MEGGRLFSGADEEKGALAGVAALCCTESVNFWGWGVERTDLGR